MRTLSKVWWAVALALFLAAGSSARASKEEEMPCRREHALDEAASRLLAEDAPSVREALRGSGSDLTSVRWWRGRVAEGAEARRWLHRLGWERGGETVCGMARREGRVLWLAALRAGGLTIERGKVSVRLLEGFAAPRLYALDANGTPLRIGLQRVAPLRWTGRLPPVSEVRRPLRVQLLARGPRGLQPVSERDVGGVWHPPWALDPFAPSERAERGVGGLPRGLALWREALGVAPLRPNRLLGRLAAERASRACALVTGPLGHEPKPGEGPVERLAAWGLRARTVGEVLARGARAAATLEALLQSPSHVAVLSERRWTDAGWALRRSERGGWCLAVLLSRWPRPVPAGVRLSEATTPPATACGGRPRAAPSRRGAPRAPVPRAR